MGLLTIGEIAEMMGGTVIDGDPCVTISDYSYNSKEGDSETLFLPIVGERVDAHNFIKDAASHGMIATVTERGRIEEDTDGMTYIAVDNTQDAIGRLGMRYRSCYDVPCIGITGSVGKTTTKEMIFTALREDLNTIKTEGNKNGQLGVPLMCLKMDEDTECLVLEMGVSLPGEMERLSKIADPTMAVLTNIGMSHIGNFLKKENTRKEKLAVINEMDDKGVLLLNGEDELLAELLPGSPNQKDLEDIDLYDKTREVIGNIKRYSYGLSKWCDFYADDIEATAEGTKFVFKHDELSFPVELSVSGKHNVLNAVVALAFATLLEVNIETAIASLKEYKPMAMRGTIEKLANDITLIDDSYNASPDSMRSGLEVLGNVVNTGRKIAVLADMLELGEYAEECHRLVGQYVAKSKADILVAIGSDAKFIAEEAKNKENIEVNYFETRDEALEYLTKTINTGDAISFKGSRGMGLDKLAVEIRKMFAE